MRGKTKNRDDKYVIISQAQSSEGGMEGKGGEEGREGGESVIDGVNGGREGAEIC